MTDEIQDLLQQENYKSAQDLMILNQFLKIKGFEHKTARLNVHFSSLVLKSSFLQEVGNRQTANFQENEGDKSLGIVTDQTPNNISKLNIVSQ